MLLTWTGASKSSSVDLVPGLPQQIDVVAGQKVERAAALNPCTTLTPHRFEGFIDTGRDYIFHVAVHAPDAGQTTVKLKVTWGYEWDDLKAEMVS